jgi:ribosomal protein S18 acetylase RimI-like enzyme
MLSPPTVAPTVRARHDLSPGEIDALEEHLYAFNAERTGYADGAGLGFVAEAGGELLGAVGGYSWGGICELRQVWVAETHRGEGIGRALMQAALAEAAARGCAHVFLATYDFQAPDFYRRLGFEVVARIPDKPLGHTEFLMRLSLPAS